jgi:hypothetical protein
MNEKSGEDPENLRHFSKTDLRYWQQVILRKGYSVDGERRQTHEFYARMQHPGSPRVLCAAYAEQGGSSGAGARHLSVEAVFRRASNHQTIENYAKKFRQIVSEIFGLSEGEQKHDFHRGGVGKWLWKVHGVKLVEVTPTRVQEWKRSFLARAGSDPPCSAQSPDFG